MTERHKLTAAVHVLLTRDDDVLLLLRANTGFEDGNYGLIAGHIEPRERVIDAAIREAREEAGIELDPAAAYVCGVMHPNDAEGYVYFFVACDRWSGDVRNAEPDRCTELRWFAADALPDNVVPYVRRAIEKGPTTGPWFDSFGWPDESSSVEPT